MQDKLVVAAIAIADSEGIAALSLRGVAARLETPVMSLYRHVENKEQLFQLMTENVLAEERQGYGKAVLPGPATEMRIVIEGNIIKLFFFRQITRQAPRLNGVTDLIMGNIHKIFFVRC